MFVRKKKNRSGSVSVQTIKKKNRINKVVKTIGSSKDPDEVDRLFQKGLYELPRLFGPTLFDDIREPDISELSNDYIRVVGPELVFGKIFDHIVFNVINDRLFGDLCISRITHPGSKLELSKYLRENNREEISEDRIYYFMDRLNTKLFISYSQQRAKKDAFNREKGLKRLEKSLRAGRLTKSNINNRGYNKYLQLEGEIKIKIDYEKFENDQKWDGLKGLIRKMDIPTAGVGGFCQICRLAGQTG